MLIDSYSYLEIVTSFYISGFVFGRGLLGRLISIFYICNVGFLDMNSLLCYEGCGKLDEGLEMQFLEIHVPIFLK